MEQLLVLIIFLVSYFLFVVLHRFKHLVACAGCILLALFRLTTVGRMTGYINWNIIGVFVGTLIVADLFMRSGAPGFLAGMLVAKIRNATFSILALCFISGVLSIALENVAVVLIVAPVAFALAEKLDIRPVTLLIAIAVSSNLQGTATLIGDPPSMLLAAYARLNFNDFFFLAGRPSIFFAIQLAAAGSLIVLYFVFRRYSRAVEVGFQTKVTSWMPTFFLCALIAGLIGASVIDPDFRFLAGTVCLFCAAVSIAWSFFGRQTSLSGTVRGFDWQSTLFLMGVFILVGSLVEAGWMDELSNVLERMLGGNIFLTFSMLVIFSVLISAFVDNVPYLAAMLPVARNLATDLGSSEMLFMFALLIGACLGGNITPVGASANIVAYGQLRQKGYEVRFCDFVKIGLPFTLVAVTLASLFVWFIWG
ncbi:MAG: hypothetical protein JW844_05090 [Candidatus Omnitrophica bacterium]|nr:hypothetical protein [Candidatus Omnitrophota bacterium]